MEQKILDAQKKLNRNFQRDAMTAIRNNDDIIFITYSAIDKTEEKIIYVLAKILEKHKREDIFTPVLSCIKELIANATKAIAKKILIDEGKITDKDDAATIVKQIRSILNKDALMEYGIKAKNRRLSTRTYIKVINDNLVIEVINNTLLSEKEHNRMLDKIEQSSKYDSLAEYYIENPDPEAEGMGLGISMIVVLLKNINISYKNFLYSTNGKDKTYAKIIIPLV